MPLRFLPVMFLALLLSSCADKMQNREAVERGIRKGVASRGVNVDAMDVHVTDVKFHDGKADAVVSFAPKGGDPLQGLNMKYTLEPRENEWVITARSPMDLKSHTGGAVPNGGMPDNSMRDGAIPGMATPMPPGHPAVPGSAPGTPK